MTQSNIRHQTMSKTRHQNVTMSITRHQNVTKNNNTSSPMLLDHWPLLYIRFVVVALQLWRRSPLEKGPSLTYYDPALDPSLGGFVIIAIHLVCCCSLPTLKKESFGGGPLIDLLWPCPGSSPGWIWPKSQYKCAGSWVLYSYQVW